MDVTELIAFASDPALVVDEAQRVIGWNAAAERLLGYSFDDAAGRTCDEVVGAVLADGEPLCQPSCEGAMCFGRCQPYSVAACMARTRDGARVAVGISTLVVPAPKNGRAPGDPAAVIFLHPAEAQSAPKKAEAAPLRIYTFGRFGVVAGERGLAVETWQRKQAVTLLKFLSHNPGRVVHRERLIELLWPDSEEEQGRKRLKVTVYFLRRKLREAGLGDDVVKTVGPGYLLREDRVWIDRLEFENLARRGEELATQGDEDGAKRSLEAAQRLYRGDYLEEDLYADWCAEERENLCEIYFDLMTNLAERQAVRGNFASAAQACRTVLVREPCREVMHRTLMRYLMQSGRPDQALTQYAQCCRVLADELGVNPSSETEKLYRSIVAGNETDSVRESH